MENIVLLTGFEPFDGESLNPSWEAVRLLDGWRGDDFVVVARQLPCVFGRSRQMLRAALDELKPVLAIAVGEAGGRAGLTPERLAVNLDDAPIPDNEGSQPVDQAVEEGGPAAYFSTLPIKAIVAALGAAGLAAALSESAGTFVCNHVFYGLMTGTAGSATPAGFIHVPYLPSQAAAHPGAPAMELADMVAGLRIAVEVSLAHADPASD